MSRIKPRRKDRPAVACKTVHEMPSTTSGAIRSVQCDGKTRHVSGLCYKCRKGGV